MRILLIACLLACLLMRGLAAEATPEAAYAASLSAERGGDYVAARAALAPFERRLAGDYVYQVRMAWLALCAGDHRAALAGYRAAQGLAPQSLEPLLGQARAQLLAERWSDAESAARQVLRVDRMNYTAILLLSSALRAESRADEARRALGELLERYPCDVTALKAAALVAKDCGCESDAREMSALALKLDLTAAR